MKNTITFIRIILFSLIITSCTQNELSIPEDESFILSRFVPCNFDFNSTTANQTINIDCDYDLEGATINFPENVTLQYNGGSITNGTVILKNGFISGELLNITLAVEGSAALLNTTFFFDPNKWGIVQGTTSDGNALINRDNTNVAIVLVKRLGAVIFDVDNIDAYFDVQADNYNRSTSESLILPSDFHFRMTNNSHLRVQTNAKPAYALLSAQAQQNVTITGGHIWGDRYEHIYATGTEGDTHEFGYGVYFRGVINGIVDNVELRECTGDGFIVQSTKWRNDDGSEKPGETYSKNIRLSNCFIDKNRRNNISLTDVDGMVIEDNIISNGGDGGPWNSSEGYNYKGVLPRYNIDFEAINHTDDTGDLRYTEIVQNIIVRNNAFSGAFNGDIDLYKCWDVEIHNNTFDASIANVASFDIQIHDNVFTNTRPELSDRKFAFQIKELIRSDGSDYNVNYEIYNNTITRYENGIKLGGTNQTVYNNTINECRTGIMFLNGSDNVFYDNVITSDISGSRGYYSLNGGAYMRNTVVTNDVIRVNEFGLLLQTANVGETTNRLTFNECTFTAYKGIELRNSNNITIENSTFSDYTNKESTNIILENNN